MKLNNPQKSVISNIFRDLSKLTTIALVIGPFVQGQVFNFPALIGGLITVFVMGTVAVIFATDKKEAN